MDKIKRDSYMGQTAINMYDRTELRLDHPNQRDPDTWSDAYRDGYISTMIKGEDVDPIKICEEFHEGNARNYVIDGGHRINTLWMFKNNAFKLGRSVEMPIIAYDEEIKDKNGNYVRNDNGEVSTKEKKFDVRGKYYRDLPDKLKESFNENKVSYIKHLNCTREETIYNLTRYNKQKSMNTNENIVAGMLSRAEDVKNISKNNRFFKDCGVYTETERRNGTIERCVIESIMCINYLSDWKKTASPLAKYIDINATDEDFKMLNNDLTELKGVIEKDIITKDVHSLFNSKDSFIWFAAYNRFKLIDNDMNNFIEFLIEFANSNEMQNKLNSFKTDSNSTKDKSVIEAKLNYIEKLMLNYLHINIEDKQPEEVVTEEISTLDFVRENVGQVLDVAENGNKFTRDITDDDIELYREDFELFTVDIDGIINSKLMDKGNEPSVLSLIAYGYKEDKQLDEWFNYYFSRNDNYIHNQKQNFLHMKESLDKYVEKMENSKLPTIMMNGGKMACATQR